ncbi:Neuropeptide CCHamide-1 receptor [Holothuria leucospilota]|uniref:Neuropeptide CCHamide-1 receptor n=1 Tax=Holothuria leucospilota TaxID=206669 RepID=A0A9Q1CGM4_HOLLE|nr:Neuropeptide CCHamide-1 receptor [Holothuria leucospilota]
MFMIHRQRKLEENKETIMQFSTKTMVDVVNISTSATEVMSTLVTSPEITSYSKDCEGSEVYADAQIWMLVLFCVFFIFGVFGNGILVLLFFMEKKLRTIHNAFVTNLAFSDFLFVLLFAPIKFFEEYKILRPLGMTFCYISIIINYMSQDVSTLSMTALSFYRYLAVMRPLKTKRDKRKIKWFILTFCAISWILGAIAAIYPASDCTVFSDECLLWDRHYVDSFTDNESHLKFHIVRFVFFYILPLIVIALFYTIMACKLCKTPSTLQRNDSISARRATKSRKKLGGVVLAIVVIFFLSWLPNYLTWFTGLDDTSFIEWLTDMRSVCMFLPASLNPILLFVTSSSYRKPILGIFSPWNRSGRHFVRQLRKSSFSTSLTSIRLSRLSRHSKRSSDIPSPT